MDLWLCGRVSWLVGVMVRLFVYVMAIWCDGTLALWSDGRLV